MNSKTGLIEELELSDTVNPTAAEKHDYGV